jgi:hypothetical protein
VRRGRRADAWAGGARDYPTATLKKWKAQREASGQAALAGLRQVTEERLQEFIADAIYLRDREVRDAIGRFERVDSEAAAVLRDLVRQLEEAGLASSYLNPDSVNTLNRAARKLQASVNEDVVSMLDRAASKLEDLPVIIERLSEVASELRRAGPYM